MSDIGPGDVVVCVDHGGRHMQVQKSPMPPLGSRQVVAWVGITPSWHNQAGQPVLGIEGYPNDSMCGDLGWLAERFRKADRGDLGELLNVLEVHPRETVGA